jgi:flagellar biosynthesis/type III secretory pathway chaperone
MSAPPQAALRGRMPRPHHPLTQLARADATQIIPIVEADPLGADVLAHLDAQIASVQRLLEIVLEQGAAIRSRDVHTVVRFAGLLHGEIARRQQIEETRSRLLERAGGLLGIPAQAVTLSRLSVLLDPARAQLAAERSAQLRGLIEELRREHSCNRALMQIELSFLDHLMQSLALDAGVHSYDSRGTTSGASAGGRAGGRAPVHALRVLDLSA